MTLSLKKISRLFAVAVLYICSIATIAASPQEQTTDSLFQAQIISLTDSLHRSTTQEVVGMARLKMSERNIISDGQEQVQEPVTAAAKDTVQKVSRHKLRAQRLETFIPDPNRATWSAIVFPGGGQIYNHKYWKLPVVYGGFLGCAYALNWNNQMYSDYSQAYLDIMDDDPNTASYEDFLPPRYDVEGNKDYLKRIFKNRKDNYRRQRDMSIFCFIGVYLLSAIDAYVDAELSNFDITDDLSVQIRPNIIDNQHAVRNQSYGLQCSFSF